MVVGLKRLRRGKTQAGVGTIARMKHMATLRALITRMAGLFQW